MKKLAIFVEGHTESLFIEKLITEIAGKENLTILHAKGNGGRKFKRCFNKVELIESKAETKYYILINNSCTDSRVVSDINENVEKLSKKGFEKVIGLKDIYPLTDTEKIKSRLYNRNYGLKTKYLPTEMILAVMEIEAWFIAETTHFIKIDERLTFEFIRNHIGLDLGNSKYDEIVHPASVLDDIYKLVAKEYNKQKEIIQETVNVLDFANIYLSLTEQLSALKKLITEINLFLEIET